MNNTDTQIAIIGLAGRFPQAENLEAFWELLKNGREAVVAFSDAELLASGVDPALLQHPDYVKSGVVVPGIADFDAGFFEMSSRDAEIIDPQQRIFLECAWQALEQAGYPPSTSNAIIGVYAGVGDNDYLPHCLQPNIETLLPTVGSYRLFALSGKDFLATRVAYKLNLTGPALTVQTACSTSLVATHLACQSLLNMECDIALAGGTSFMVPQEKGYLYQEGMIRSPDGHCRAFDARAQGTVGGGGVGVVVLKRLDDALADGDTIHAVILGSAINNDGADKVGYTAPGVSGQRAVILEAQSVAQVHPDDISYIEAHGTGTALGDPMEIQALTQAFRANTQRKGYCAIGSVKTNIGHADAAAGISGLIKTVLALKHHQLPPSLHYTHPNPQIDFANSPFFVNTTLREWESDNTRCAGVSSFGIGGTNAHVIVAEAPEPEPGSSSRPLQLITLSAKTSSALDQATRNLHDWLHGHQETDLADVAYTLNQGRQSFTHRRSYVCANIDEALQQLAAPANLASNKISEKAPSVVFLFPGQGSQYVNMTRNLYANEPVFKATIDECASLLSPYLEKNLRDVLYSDKESQDALVNQTSYTQPALFAVEYALAKLWMSWGIQPSAMLGHSIGEYVAACLAGVFALEDGLALVAARAKLTQSLPSGTMLAVPLSEANIQPWLTSEMSLAVVNGTDHCVVSGTHPVMTALQENLQTQGIESRALHTSHAFHSHLLEPILEPFAQKVRAIKLHPPQMPYLSNFSGDWIRPEQATDPDYWVSHLRHTVRFADNVRALFKHQARNAGVSDILLEVGPGQTLINLVRRHPEYSAQCVLLPSLPRQRNTENQAEMAQVLDTLGQLWCHDVRVDWHAFYAEEKRHRLPLPTYPFERQRYWIDAPKRQVDHNKARRPEQSPVHAENNSTDAQQQWLYQPHWLTSAIPAAELSAEASATQHWLVFEDTCGVSQQLQQALLQQGHTVTTVQRSSAFEQQTANAYCINPQRAEDYESLVQALAQAEFPSKCLHCWTVNERQNQQEADDPFEQSELTLQLGFYSLLYLTQALGTCNINQALDITVLSNQMQAVIGSDQIQPAKATVLGAVKTIGQEIPSIQCRSIDITLPFDNERQTQGVLAELATPITETVIAYRQGLRWTQNYQPVPWQTTLPTHRLRRQGTYLITGGLGGIGLTLAEYLAHHVQAKLVLVGRSAFPAKTAWQAYLSEHEQSDAIRQKILLLQKLESEGAEVLVYSADVADRRQMQEVIESCQQYFDQIHGVIHAAGIADGALIATRDHQTSASVLAPKVTGTWVLHQLLADKQLDFFVLCSSLASIVGIPGQIAYCAANAFQDAFAQAQRQHPHTLFTAINWDTWQQVGMAVKALSQSPAGVVKQAIEERPLTHPLFHAARKDGQKITYISQLNTQLWVLDDHRIMFGSHVTLMPGTGYLEWARAALLQHQREMNLPVAVVVFQEVYFLHPLVVEDNIGKTMYTTLIPNESDKETVYEFIISSQADNHKQLEHARGRIKASAADTASQVYSLDQLRHDCHNEIITVTPEFIKNNHSNVLERKLNLFGQRWHNLQQVYLGDKQGLAYLALPAPLADDVHQYALHPGLLDMATGFLKMCDAQGSQGASLPFYYQSITVYAPLPARFYSYARISKQDDAVLDIHLLDEQGILLVEISGFTLRKIEERTVAFRQVFWDSDNIAIREEPEPDAAENARSAEILSHGLLPEEGIAVFEQVLQSQYAQILVAKQGLSALFEQVKNWFNTRLTEAENSTKKEKDRPLSAPPYVAPRTEMEEKLAAIWQKFLGIAPIGIEDDFFEFGGDSLLAVQLTTYVRAELQVDLSIQALLNTPTITNLVKLMKPADAKNASDPDEPQLLLKIQTGNLKNPPLIMVHPIGGYVYLYRDLAQQLDKEQALYGIQAVGIDGKSAPLSQVEAMATHYIRALRKYQPTGPYLLGGSSFGGMVAYEMALQLQQQGEDIPLLVLIDAPAPGNMSHDGLWEDDVDVMAFILKVGSGIQVSADDLRKMDEQSRWAWFVKEMSGDSSRSSQVQSRIFMNLFRANTQAMYAYQTQSWDGDGKAIFFSAMEQYAFDTETTEKKWQELVQGNLTIYPIPGTHLTINSMPSIKIVADHIQQAINRTFNPQ